MKFKDVALKAKEGVRKKIAPTNADRYEEAKRLKAKNDVKLEKIRSMEAVKAQKDRAVKLAERERKARNTPSWMKQERPSSQSVSKAHALRPAKIGDPFEAFNSPLFGAGGSSGSSSGKKGKQKEPEFPDFNFL